LNKINLDQPIFVYYINVEGLSKQRANENIARIYKDFSFTNCQFWIIPFKGDRETSIECIYDGGMVSKNELSEEIVNLIEVLNERIDFLSGTTNAEDFKINLRDWRINETLK